MYFATKSGETVLYNLITTRKESKSKNRERAQMDEDTVSLEPDEGGGDFSTSSQPRKSARRLVGTVQARGPRRGRDLFLAIVLFFLP